MLTHQVLFDRIKFQFAHDTGDDWVPGGEGRRTASGPEGSSAKAFPSGDQDHLVVVGIMGRLKS
jgi:hypothetical protein